MNLGMTKSLFQSSLGLLSERKEAMEAAFGAGDGGAAVAEFANSLTTELRMRNPKLTQETAVAMSAKLMLLQGRIHTSLSSENKFGSKLAGLTGDTHENEIFNPGTLNSRALVGDTKDAAPGISATQLPPPVTHPDGALQSLAPRLAAF